MSEYRLAKNSKNELAKTDESHKAAKVSKNTKLTPKKNCLVQTTDGTITICVNTGKGLVKLTNKALSAIGNKLKEVNWENVILTLLKNMFFTTQKTNKVYYRKIKTYTTKVQQSPCQEQPQEVKTQNITVNNTKQIANKKQKSIKNNNAKQIEQQKRNILKPEHNYLMIEKKNKQKKEK